MPKPGRATPPEPGRGADRVSIDASTRLYAVIGHPVAHSLSPRMQNAAFAAAGTNAAYAALDVTPPQFAEALGGLYAAGFAGLNVTLPHKEEALRLSRSATDRARAAGVANTLRRGVSGWEADATDGAGFLAWLETLRMESRGCHALVVGAGGASRGVVVALAQAGAARITVVNRSAERAHAVVRDARAAVPGALVEAAPWGGAFEGRTLGLRGGKDVFDFLVRAVSVEVVAPEEREWWMRVRPTGAVLDLNYGERARGARQHAMGFIRYEDGLALLVEQGALSYEFWTGAPAPRQAMREALG